MAHDKIHVTWFIAAAQFAVLEAGKNDERVFYLQNMYRHVDMIVYLTDSNGDSPENTLRATIQMLRNIGLIEFTNNKGTYRFLLDPEEAYHKLKKLGEKHISRGERKLGALLRWAGIDFQREKRFPDMLLNGQLRFDTFFTLVLSPFNIEWNGIHHMIAVPYHGGVKTMLDTMNRDRVKRNYCKAKGITQLIIWWHRDFRSESTKTFRAMRDIMIDALKTAPADRLAEVHCHLINLDNRIMQIEALHDSRALNRMLVPYY